MSKEDQNYGGGTSAARVRWEQQNMHIDNRPSEIDQTLRRSTGMGGVAAKVSAWEMIEIGRYMPRRVRGSFPGRELG